MSVVNSHPNLEIAVSSVHPQTSSARLHFPERLNTRYLEMLDLVLLPPASTESQGQLAALRKTRANVRPVQVAIPQEAGKLPSRISCPARSKQGWREGRRTVDESLLAMCFAAHPSNARRRHRALRSWQAPVPLQPTHFHTLLFTALPPT